MLIREFASPSVIRSLALLVALACASVSYADVWVFEPSASVDQRIDDNYRLDPYDSKGVAATRAVGSVELSRESQNYDFRGQARIDALLSINEDNTNSRSSNQVLFLQTRYLQPRYTAGLTLNFKQDTPSRDISADITDLSQTASDTGASVTQDQNIDRQRLVFSPSLEYSLSRRTRLTFKYTYTNVAHGLPTVQDAIDRQVQTILANENAPQSVKDALLALDRPATINDIGRFTIDDELDDFSENLLEMQLRHQLTRIDTLTSSLSFSQFEAQSELASPEAERVQDSREDDILRNPRYAAGTETARVSFGYQRSFSTTFTAGIALGYFTSDAESFGTAQSLADLQQNGRVTDTNTGYTVALTASKLAGISRFSGKIGVEVYPSDVGEVVESLEAVGDYQRELGPLLDFTLRLRAYEPDAISDAENDDKFARRFFSMEPKLIWRFKRAWTAAVSYRYRRQKSQVDPVSGESNAILFSIKYTPPSAIADARRAGGLTR